jgi:hypothetical protein
MCRPKPPFPNLHYRCKHTVTRLKEQRKDTGIEIYGEVFVGWHGRAAAIVPCYVGSGRPREHGNAAKATTQESPGLTEAQKVRSVGTANKIARRDRNPALLRLS